MSAWGCPHDVEGICHRVHGAVCSPGMRGCVLEGRVRFADPGMNASRKPVRANPETPAADTQTESPPPLTRPKRRLPF